MPFVNQINYWSNDEFPGCEFVEGVGWSCCEHENGCAGSRYILEEIRRRCHADAWLAAGLVRACDDDCAADGLVCFRDEDTYVSFCYDVDRDDISALYNHDHCGSMSDLLELLPKVYGRFIEMYTTQE